ncbi:MAG: hypothetical protein IKW92_06395 [Firmicutes bacterium]|nr:hypothetical protein [Bacillota bacterium]
MSDQQLNPQAQEHRNYYSLEEFAERRRLQEELRNAIDKTIPGYEVYAQAMEELNKKMDAYSVLDQWGVAKQIDEAGKQELMEAIKTTALAGEELLKNAKGSVDPKVQKTADTVRKLQGAMSRDMNLLQLYDPNGPEKKSLPELQEDARTSTVDIGDKEFEKMSGFQSERIPMTLQNAKGKKISGFFTKASKFTILPEFNSLLKRMDNLSDDKEFFKDFLSKYRQARMKQTPAAKDYSDEYLIGEILQKSGGGQPNALKMHLGKVFGKDGYEMNDIFGYNGLKVFSEGLQKIAATPASYMNLMMDMKEGERFDQRNSAMSAVADVLGVPNLIARSRNMKFRDSKGNVVEGTFMDVAKGTDLGGGKNENAQKLSKQPFKGAGSEGLRQLCDLQVLDYICGNIDRHSGNIVYELDKDGKIIGVQGIDNDTSFTRFHPENRDLNDLMTAPKNMRVISKSMRDKIMNMDEAMLKFSLRGRGLSEEEMDASVERLKITKKAIQESEKHYGGTFNFKGKVKPDKNHLLILDDKDFKNLDISYLRHTGKKEATSTINEVDKLIQIANEYKAGVQAGTTERKDVNPLNLKSFDTTEKDLMWSTVRQKVGTTRQYIENVQLYNGRKTVNSVDDLTNTSHGSSPEWDKMVANMKALNKYNAGAYRDKNKTDQILTTEQYVKTQGLWAQLDKSADDYLAKKMREKGVTDLKKLVGKNDYEKDRIEYAKRVKQYTSKHKIDPLTDHQKEVLKQHDEGDLIELNKKMKEEALKIQKAQQNKGPQAGM